MIWYSASFGTAIHWWKTLPPSQEGVRSGSEVGLKWVSITRFDPFLDRAPFDSLQLISTRFGATPRGACVCCVLVCVLTSTEGTFPLGEQRIVQDAPTM